MLTRLDVALRRADHGVIFLHGLAGSDTARGDLVARGYLRADSNSVLGAFLPEAQGASRDQDVVVRVQPDQRRRVEDGSHRSS